MNKMSAKQTGFTIVELLIVIVVIGILAAITIVAYSGIQAKARDAQRKEDVAQIAKALQLYGVDKGNFVSSSGGCATGNGWYWNDYDGAGPLLSVNQCLINGGYLSKELADPLTNLGCSGTYPSQDCFYYMKYDCGATAYVYANLETMPHSTTDTDGTCNTTLDSLYGMNYFVAVN